MTLHPPLVLALETLLALGLAGGAFLARRKRYGTHQAVQTCVVLANIVVVGWIMIPSLDHQLGAGNPPALIWIHAGAGALALLVAVFVVVAATFGWLRQFKPWMRSALGLWWVAFLLGIGVYYVLNVQSAPPAPVPAQDAPAANTVTIKNFSFTPAELTIPVGTEVTWTDTLGRHSVQADNGSFKSGALTANGTFKHKFDKPGRYPYFCEFHGSKGGHDMAGVIVVTPK